MHCAWCRIRWNKDAVKKAGGFEGLGIKAEIPDSGAKKRYAEGWVVVKIVKLEG